MRGSENKRERSPRVGSRLDSGTVSSKSSSDGGSGDIGEARLEKMYIKKATR